MQENPKVLEYFNHPAYWQNLLHREVDDPLNEYAFRTAPQRAAADGPITLYISAYHAFPKAKILYKTALTYFSIDLPYVSDIASKSTTWKFEQTLLIANRLDVPLMCIWYVPKIPTEYVRIHRIVSTSGFSIFRNRYKSKTITSHLSSYHKHEGYQRYDRRSARDSLFDFTIEDAGKKFRRTSNEPRDLKAVKMDLKKPNIIRSDPIRLLICMPLNPHDASYSISDNRINLIENGIPWTIGIYDQDDPYNPVWQSVSLARAPNNYTSCEIYKNGFLLRTETQSDTDTLHECDIYGNITPLDEPINFASHKENRTYSAGLTEPIDYEMLEMSNCESTSQTRAFLALDDDSQLAREWQRPLDSYAYREIYNSIDLIPDSYIKRLPSE